MARGQDCKAYYSSTSTSYSSPTWVEITRVVNDSIELAAEEITGANRSSEYKSTANGTKQLSGTLTYERKDSGVDTVYRAFQTAWAAGTVIDMLFVDGAYATASGYRAPMKCTSISETRDLDNVVTVELSLKSTVWDDSGTLREPTAWLAGSSSTF